MYSPISDSCIQTWGKSNSMEYGTLHVERFRWEEKVPLYDTIGPTVGKGLNPGGGICTYLNESTSLAR